MGQRISYTINQSGKTLKQLLLDEFKEFRRWLVEMETNAQKEFKEAFVEAPLFAYCKTEADLKADFDKLESRLVNELLAVFICNYSWWKGREDRTFVPVGPWMYCDSYKASDALVLDTQDVHLIRLWDFLVKGRSIQGHRDFQTYSGDYTIGFLSFAEQEVLKDRIRFHFGSATTAVPQHAGLGYVLHALSETEGMEIVTEVE